MKFYAFLFILSLQYAGWSMNPEEHNSKVLVFVKYKGFSEEECGFLDKCLTKLNNISGGE